MEVASISVSPTTDTTTRPADAPVPPPVDAPPQDAPQAAAPAPTRTADGVEPAVVAAALTRRFEDVTAVQDISFTVPAGTILGIIGPSGSGKTTTLKMLMGALEPSDGKVRVLGTDPLHFRRETRERIGYMPQQFILYPDLTAKENLDFVASLFGLLVFRRGRRVKEVLKLVNLWDARGRRAKDLSGGMQRRLELASALVHQPRLLVLDEPTAGIDPILRKTIWDELHRLRDTGVTILVTTQYVTEAEECDEVALISEGRLIGFAVPEELRRSAYGGDIVEITTEETFDATTLAPMARVRAVRQTGLRDFRVVVDDAGAALPELVDAVGTAGGEVAAAREARPNFEEVFAELVARDQLQRERAEEIRAAAKDQEEPQMPDAMAAAEPPPVSAVEVPPEPSPEEDEPPARRPEDDFPPPQRAPGEPASPEVQRAPGVDETPTTGETRGRR